MQACSASRRGCHARCVLSTSLTPGSGARRGTSVRRRGLVADPRAGMQGCVDEPVEAVAAASTASPLETLKADGEHSGGIQVKVTIDATDSVSDTIRVINALFDVTLAQ